MQQEFYYVDLDASRRDVDDIRDNIQVVEDRGDTVEVQDSGDTGNANNDAGVGEFNTNGPCSVSDFNTYGESIGISVDNNPMAIQDDSTIGERKAVVLSSIPSTAEIPCRHNDDLTSSDNEQLASGSTKSNVRLNEDGTSLDNLKLDSFTQGNTKKSRSRDNQLRNALMGMGFEGISSNGRQRHLNRKFCYAANLNTKKSILQFGESHTNNAVYGEVKQMGGKEVWKYLRRIEVKRLIRECNINILPSSLFLKDKYFANGEFEKLKARLVCCGNYQRAESLEEKDTESPTVSINTVLILLSIAAKLKLVKHVYDVSGAYLNADLVEPEYMKINRDVVDIILKFNPEYSEYVMEGGHMVVELKKALYGLKQASRRWYSLLSGVLIKNGYFRSTIDSCLFYKDDINGDITYILVYVDDLLVMGSNEGKCIEVQDILRKEFTDITCKTDQELSFIGMEIVTDINGDITVKQSGYLKKLLEEYGVEDTSKYPSTSNILENSDESVCDKNTYLTLLMKIMYLAIRTRPDILYVCVVLASKNIPSNSDYDQLFTILKFLNGTIADGIIYRSEGNLNVNCYVDASFNCHHDAKGHYGFIIYPDLIGSSGVLFKSGKQKHVADSSAESELMALHECVKHLIYVMSFYEELGFKQIGVHVQQDNQAVIKLSKDEPINFKGRSKFINRKYFSVHEYVTSGDIELVYVGTDVNVADYLTKALTGSKFRRFRIDIMGSINDINRGEDHE